MIVKRRIVSRKKHLTMKVKKNNILYKKGYLRNKGDNKKEYEIRKNT